MTRENGVMFRTREKKTMMPKRPKFFMLTIALACLLPGLPFVRTAAADPVLSQSEIDGYLQWLHSLEQTVSARQNSDQPEANLLFPFEAPSWGPDEIRPYRHLAISKALGMMEQEYPGDTRRKISSAFLALSTARNYLNLSEFDSAMAWFDLAQSLDQENNFQDEITREKLGAALAAGDTLTMAHLVTNTLGKTSLDGCQEEITLVIRWLLVTRDSASMDLLLQKIEGHPDLLTDRVRFWRAYALSWQGHREPAMEDLRVLVRNGGLSCGLSEAERRWVLIAIPDLLYLNDQTDAARDLYQVLAGSELTELTNWGVNQLANLDFLDGNYLRASQGFESVCQAKRTGSFQDNACEMARMTREIQRIQIEGKPYGTAAYYRQ